VIASLPTWAKGVGSSQAGAGGLSRGSGARDTFSSAEAPSSEPGSSPSMAVPPVLPRGEGSLDSAPVPGRVESGAGGSPAARAGRRRGRLDQDSDQQPDGQARGGFRMIWEGRTPEKDPRRPPEALGGPPAHRTQANRLPGMVKELSSPPGWQQTIRLLAVSGGGLVAPTTGDRPGATSAMLALRKIPGRNSKMRMTPVLCYIAQAG
jgi:hypothetical protein